jgi:hypothetical protein
MLSLYVNLPGANLRATAALLVTLTPERPFCYLAVNWAWLRVAFLLVREVRAFLSGSHRWNCDAACSLGLTAATGAAAVLPRHPVIHLAVDWTFYRVAVPLIVNARACLSTKQRLLHHWPTSGLPTTVAFLGARGPQSPETHLAVHRTLHSAALSLFEQNSTATAIVLRLLCDLTSTRHGTPATCLRTLGPLTPRGYTTVHSAGFGATLSIFFELGAF